MYELFAFGETLPEAYHEALVQLHRHHNIVDVPDYNTKQKEASMTMQVLKPLKEDRISRLFVGGPADLEQYVQEVCDGILDWAVAAGKEEYTYHDRLAPQIPWLLEELKRNPDTRRAVITTHRPADQLSSSPPCLREMHFFIREDRLHLKTTLRSNDAAKAAFMNAYAFIEFQRRIALQVGIPVGTYVQRSTSYHVYERDWPMFDSYVDRILNGDEHTYSYKADWKEQMDEAWPVITAKFAALQGGINEYIS